MPGKLIVCRGLPASGKTTWAKQFVQSELNAGHKAINIDRDMFRIAAGFGTAPTGDFEVLITQQQRSIIKHALNKGWTVVESSTNLRSAFLKDMFETAEFHGATYEVKDFPVEVDVAVYRDYTRELNGEHSVGENVIVDMYDRFLKNGFPKVPSPKTALYAEPYIPDESKPKAILVDIDGTVAQVNGRSPYDYTLVSTDTPKQWVIDIISDAVKLGYKIIFMSGREYSSFYDTSCWLNEYVDVPCLLYMRPTGDTRMDAVVKLELFNEHVRNDYNLLYCLDDRRQVIDAYRAIGLNVLDVAGHDF